MKKRSNLLLLLIILSTIKINATTWDEPWAEEVIRNSGSFVLGKVISSDPGQGLKVLILKNLGGNVLSGTIIINDFYSLKICSSSGGHDAEFTTEQTDSCYFLIKRNSKEGY